MNIKTKKLTKYVVLSLGDLYIGKKFSNRYQIREKIGNGTFGAVYLVDDTNINSK